MEQYGNTATFNVESVLQKNIVNSEYYRDTCMKLGTWEEVVDEIYYSVQDVEPWMSGNARGASSAFCLLYRLFTLVPSKPQIKNLLDHTDSPYIRAVGFLYLRYAANPRTLWEWIQPYVRDSEEIDPSPEGHGKTVTMGEFVRDVFLEQYYFETIFPRIPKPVHDDFVSKLTALGLPSRAVGNAGQGGTDRRGIEEANRRPASVKASLSVAFGQRAPNRATAREEGRGLGAGMKGGSGAALPPPRSPARPRDRDVERERRPDGGSSRDRDRERDRGRSDRDRDRDRHSSRDARIGDRDRDREREKRRDDAGDRKRHREEGDRDRGREHKHRHSSRDRDGYRR
ncbi:PRP38-domain-containing protein [Coccomyxa subellipsoidea C-169]|uniref:Pre-mRNA-splicing factor 38 n=1 Tax=Coccomyxa subellipsoidea (strain C-169) TaxID=574566 RepID=I0Z2X4_COCSC|nr:PRP38-domain-containing protein [Coccomyxa subellipsoidea C-169]EIE24993.1 PRP38-domain-containing protein [Coccomyxa subellipsoidea C-169]|eukprot:XP_005649537.1 PRP38-domain-containing protein [Coccomyxa subellipsoidea C-169]